MRQLYSDKSAVVGRGSESARDPSRTEPVYGHGLPLPRPSPPTDTQPDPLLAPRVVPAILTSHLYGDRAGFSGSQSPKRGGESAPDLTALNPAAAAAALEHSNLLSNLDRFASESLYNLAGSRKLWPHQIAIYENLGNKMEAHKPVEAGPLRCWVELPTGTGKTGAMATVALGLNPRSFGGKILHIVPTVDLVRQAEGSTNNPDEAVKGFARFAPELSVSKFYGGAKSLDGDVVVTTYDSLAAVIEQANALGIQFPVVQCDEAHRSLSENRQELISKIPGARVILAVTATTDFNLSDKSVIKAFGKEEGCVYQMTLGDAIEGKLLVRPEPPRSYAGVDISKVKVDSSGNYDEAGLQAAGVDLKARFQQIAATLKIPAYEGKSTVCFCSGTSKVDELAQMLRDNGISAASVHSKMTRAERDDVLAKHQRGEIQVICSDRVLKEGWDCPRCELAFMVTPTCSLVDAIQRLGRVLRLSSETGKECATIFEWADEDPRIVTVAKILGGDFEYFIPRGGDSLGDEGASADEDTDSEKRARKPPTRRELEAVGIITDEYKIDQILRQATVRERLPFRVLKSDVVGFLKSHAAEPLSDLLDTTVEIPTRRGVYEVTGRALLSNYIEVYDKSLDLSEKGLRKLADGVLGSVQQKRAFLDLRAEVSKLIALARKRELESKLADFLIDNPAARGMHSFAMSNVPLGDDQSVSGRTILNAFGITDSISYGSFVSEVTYGLLESDPIVAASDRELRDGHVPATVPPFEVKMASSAGPETTRRFLSELGFGGSDEVFSKSFALSSKVDGEITGAALFAHLAAASGVDPRLSRQTVRSIFYDLTKMSREAREFGDNFEARAAVGAAARAGTLNRQILDGLPSLSLMTAEEVRAQRVLIDDVNVPGAVLLSYFGSGDEGYIAMTERLIGSGRIADARSQAIELVRYQLIETEEAGHPEASFRQRCFELPDGMTISGEAVLRFDGTEYSEFVESIGLRDPLDWLRSDPSLLQAVLSETRRAAEVVSPSASLKGSYPRDGKFLHDDSTLDDLLSAFHLAHGLDGPYKFFNTAQALREFLNSKVRS